MITLLSRLFIKNSGEYSSPTVRTAYGMMCGVLGIILNIILFAFKAFAGILSGSVAITADAFNNLSDAGSSVVTLIGFGISAKKPDSSHPFGHGRSEYIAGLIVSFIIILMGFELGKSSVGKIFNPEDVSFSYLSAAILLLSVVVKLYMAFYNTSIGKKITSPAMSAAASDCLGDAAATAVVLFSMIFTKLSGINIDAYCGLAVSVFILIAGIRAAKDTITPLLGQKADPEIVKRIEDIVLSDPEVIGIHDLVVHDYGNGRLMVSLHAEVDAAGNILDIHDAIDNIERRIADTMLCNATIHMDPIVKNDPELDSVREAVSEYISESCPGVSIHDFRMVRGQTHTNVIFDAVIPFEERDPARIVENLKLAVNAYNSTYFAVINVDKKFS